MKILLLSPASPAQSPFFFGERLPPLGLGYLISVLRDAGHQVTFIDHFLDPSPLDCTLVISEQFHFVGIHANTTCYRDVLSKIRQLESLRDRGRWKGKIMVGGPHASVSVDTIPDCVDFIVQGEGEQAVLDIVEGTATDRILRSARKTKLDDLPMPAHDVFATLPYDRQPRWFSAGPVFSMNTSRGCPFRCQFCSATAVWGRRYLSQSAERVFEEISYLVRTLGARGVYFREDNFTVSRKRVAALCELLLKHNMKLQWACESRVDTVDLELLSLMKRAGCRALYFGVESGSQRMLDCMDKGTDVEQIRQTFEWCNTLRVVAGASFLVGLPGETIGDRLTSMRLAEEITSDYWFNVFVGIPGSKFYEQVVEQKLYEYIDDIGLAYIKGHDQFVDFYYAGKERAKVPRGLCPKPAADVPVHGPVEVMQEALVQEGRYDRQTVAVFHLFKSRALFGRSERLAALRHFLKAVALHPFDTNFHLKRAQDVWRVSKKVL